MHKILPFYTKNNIIQVLKMKKKIRIISTYVLDYHSEIYFTRGLYHLKYRVNIVTSLSYTKIDHSKI